MYIKRLILICGVNILFSPLMDEHETMEQRQKSVEMPSIFPNPENPLEIKIPLFEGPLDLLLHLIRIKEVSIEEVRLSELTASYLEYVETIQSVNLDLAGEFLEIAAMLILIGLVLFSVLGFRRLERRAE